MKFKNTDGAVITSHDAMRVDYAVTSGSCTISKNTKGVTSGVVSDSFIINSFVGSCVFSFSAYFGESPANAESTNQQPSALTRTLIASSMVFVQELPEGPLTGGFGYSFQGFSVVYN